MAVVVSRKRLAQRSTQLEPGIETIEYINRRRAQEVKKAYEIRAPL